MADCLRQDCDSVREYNLANHIIFILGAPTATVKRGAGLRNFLSPLRASSIRLEDIKTVVFCVSRRFIEREWNTVSSFPKVFVFAVRHFNVFVISSFYYLRQGGYVFVVVCLSVCLSVSNFAQKLLNGFAWNFKGRLTMGQRTNG